MLFAALSVIGPARSRRFGSAAHFFIWVSVYNLFVVSVFWQMNVDLFSSEQSKRLFGLIAAGASLGAIVGSSVTAGPGAPGIADLFAARRRGAARNRRVQRRPAVAPVAGAASAAGAQPAAEEAPIGGSVFAGITHAFGSRYLVNVSLFVLLFTVTSTILYFQQAGIVSHGIHGRGAQTAFFATVDLCVNILTSLIQLFLTGRLVVLLGVALTLALLPALTILGFGALALMPTIAAVAVFQVLRRAGDYAITRPTREVLFTVVPREDRFKAKSFIDTVVYRAGDQIGAWSVALLRGAGLATAEMALVAIPLAAFWLVDALWLGRRQERLRRCDKRRRQRNCAPARLRDKFYRVRRFFPMRLIFRFDAGGRGRRRPWCRRLRRRRPPAGVLLFSDVHFDPMADPLLVDRLAAAAPVEWAAILDRSPDKSLGRYGADTNWPLLRSALAAMKAALPHPAFVLITGDFLAHMFRGKFDVAARDHSDRPIAALSARRCGFWRCRWRRRSRIRRSCRRSATTTKSAAISNCSRTGHFSPTWPK